MNKLETLENWQRQYSTYRRRYILFCAISITSLIILASLIGILGAYAFENPFLFTSIAVMIMLINIVSVQNEANYGMPKRQIKEWKKRLSKSDDAIKSFAAGVEYDASLLGLEPINKIEFRRKTT